MSKKSHSPKPTSSKDSTALDSDILESGSITLIETVCGVCSEETRSKHYGAYSCLSCRVFFRRSISESRVYICEENENCIIEKGERKGCKACRLAKCLKIGMNPKMLHSARKGPSKKQKNPPPSEASLLHNPCVDRSQIDALVLFDRYVLNRVDAPAAPLELNAIAESIEVPFVTAFRQPWLVHPRTKVPLSFHRIADVSDILDHLNREFVLYADWLNVFHDFLTLPEYVQLVLGKIGFPKYNWNLIAWRTVQADCPGLNFINGSFYPHASQLRCLPDPRGTVPVFLRSVLEVMKFLKVDETEFILLKIISCFIEESDDFNEAESKLVHEKRDKYIGILTSYVQSKYHRIVEVDAAIRVGELMLLLAAVTNVVHLANDTFHYLDSIKVFPMGNLMSEAHKNSSGPPSSSVINQSTSQVP